MDEDGSWEESSSEFVEGLLVHMSPKERNNFCQVDKSTCLSTVVDSKSTVVVSEA